jgi:hypothetical protein
VGVPDKVPPENVTPVGSVPTSEIVGAGKPVAVTLNVLRVPVANVVLLALVIAGAWSTVSEKLWVALGVTPLLAVKEIEKLPDCVGVPDSTPPENVTPVGRVPDSLIVGVGKPMAVTVNVPRFPVTKVVLFALVMPGAWFTVRVKLFVALGVTPLLALKVIGKLPVCVGVPDSTPPEKLTPVGKVPTSEIVGVGKPVAVTVNEPRDPVANVVLLALVIAGA